MVGGREAVAGRKTPVPEVVRPGETKKNACIRSSPLLLCQLLCCFFVLWFFNTQKQIYKILSVEFLKYSQEKLNSELKYIVMSITIFLLKNVKGMKKAKRLTKGIVSLKECAVDRRSPTLAWWWWWWWW